MKFDWAALKRELGLRPAQDRLGVALRLGKNIRCPFHDDSTPSFGPYAKDGKVRFKCFGCQWEGDIFDFIADFDKRDRTSVLQEYHKNGSSPRSPVNKQAITVVDLARDKKLPQGFLEALGVRNARVRNHRGVLIPYLLADGQEAPRHRFRTALAAMNGSFWDDRKGDVVPYGLNQNQGHNSCVVVEGESDTWTLWFHEFPALGIPGASMVNCLKLEHVVAFQKLYIVREPGTAGTAFVSNIPERLQAIGWKGEIRIISLHPHKDPNAAHKAMSAEEFRGFFQAALNNSELRETESKPTQITEPLPDDEDDSSGEEIIPSCSEKIIDGDFIGDMTRALTSGTPIPPQFVRETIKTILGAVIDGKIGYASHESIHTRQFNILVSPNPESGKFESWVRTGKQGSGFLHDFLTVDGRIALLDGGLFGSGEYMAKLLEETPRAFVYFDEMEETFEKDKNQGSIIEKKLLQLFDGNQIAQGSFKNEEHSAANIHLSLSGNFTLAGFRNSFAGRGSAGSGFLSRDVFSFSDRLPHRGDWAKIDIKNVNAALTKMYQALRLLENGKLIVQEIPEARERRLQIEQWINDQDPRLKPRLSSHMKRDLILRALFSDNCIVDLPKVERALLWVENQLANRYALWPEDSGSPVERMESIILRTLRVSRDKPVSEARLAIACHANRPGSGGYETFRRAIQALHYSHEIMIVGRTRKGRSLFALVGAVRT